MAARKAFPLRLSPELYDQLKTWADAEFRSVNGQIEFLLQKAVRESRRQSPPGADPGVTRSPKK